MNPIWTLSTLIVAPIFLLIALALIAISILVAVTYFRDKVDKRTEYQAALERHQRYTKFKHEYIDKVNAERRARVEQLAAANGVSVSEIIEQRYMSRDDYQYEPSVDSYQMHEEYNELGDDYNPWNDQNPPSAGAYKVDKSDLGLAFIPAGVGLLIAVIVGFAMYPFQAEYHQYRTVQGQVDQVRGEKLNGTDSGDMYISYVFEINGKQYVCEEARCSTIEQGDTAKLRCKPSYHWSGAPTNRCSFVSRESAQ